MLSAQLSEGPLVRGSTCPRFLGLGLGLGLDILTLGQVDPRTTDCELAIRRLCVRKEETALLYLCHSEHFSPTVTEFNTGFNPKDKVTLVFRIVLGLMLIVISDAEFYTEHHAESQHHAEVNLNNPAS